MKEELFEGGHNMRFGATFEESEKEEERQNEILVAFIKDVEELAAKKGVSILTESTEYSNVWTIQFTHKDNLPLWMFDVQKHQM